MDLFDIPGIVSTKEKDKNILNKTTKKASKVISKVGISLQERISKIKNSVEEHLGEYKEKYECIRDEVKLKVYIDQCIDNGIVALDTETTRIKSYVR